MASARLCRNVMLSTFLRFSLLFKLLNTIKLFFFSRNFLWLAYTVENSVHDGNNNQRGWGLVKGQFSNSGAKQGGLHTSYIFL